MKKLTFRRRLLSLTLAASVALPQASSAFAVSRWSEEGTEHRLAQVIENGQPAESESPMPRLTLLPGDSVSQPTPSAGSSTVPSAGVTPEIVPTAIATPAPTSEGENVSPSATTENIDPTTPPPDVSTMPTASPPPESAAPIPTPEQDEGMDNDVVTPVPTPTADVEPTPQITPTPPATPAVEPSAEPTLTTEEIVAPEGVEEGLPAGEELAADSVDMSVFSLPREGGDLPLTQWMWYRLGYGVKLSGDADLNAVYDLGGRFAVESKKSGTDPYGYRDYGNLLNVPNPANPEPTDRYDAQYDKVSVCVFPSSETLGRVPDQQFVGWYVYPSGAKKGQSSTDAKTWYYGDIDGIGEWSAADMEKVALSPFGSADPYYDSTFDDGFSEKTFGSLGNIWDGGKDYGYGYEVLRENGKVKYTISSITGKKQVARGDGSPTNGDNPVSFVGRWEASDESRATSITASYVVDGKTEQAVLYGTTVAGSPLPDSGAAITENQEGLADAEYFLRVPANVDSISLDLSTLELYYSDYAKDPAVSDDYNSFSLGFGKNKTPVRPHVQVTASFGAGEAAVDYTDSAHLSAVMLPRWTAVDLGGGTMKYTPGNSLGEPAHSEWSVKNIKLQPATAETQYNDITVTVTSPSGEETTTYVLHVQRLTEPTMVQTWGNTPVGMIRRATNENLKSEAAKQAALTYFADSRMFDTVNYPAGEINQDGAIFRKAYSAYAWPVDNDVDIDDTAIVVYLDSAFCDPGVDLTDSEGKRVDITDITTGRVERALELKRVEKLSPEQIGQKDGEACWYTSSGLVTAEQPVYETVSAENGTDRIDLREMNILPGIYTLRYRYTDPVDGKTYPDGYVTENGRTYEAAFTRTLVILPVPGDVDMDGAVTMADALALNDILGTQSMTGYTTLNGEIIQAEGVAENVKTNALATLFAYRVCDVNYDGVVDRADVAALKKLPNPKPVSESNSSDSDYFYIPLPTGLAADRYTRTPLAEETTDTAKLEMVFLGKEGGKTHTEGYMIDPTGPWKSLKEASGEETDPNGVELGDVFWLGVKLTNKDQMAPLESVKSFTITLVYDSYYLEPAAVLNENDWNGITIPTDGTEEEKFQARWETMMRIYNLSSGALSDGKKQTVWIGQDGVGSDYELTAATGFGRRFTTHYSTAIIPLESVPSGLDAAKRLQTVTFSVELPRDGTALNLKNQEGDYLFALPFCLVNHPFNQTTARLVEVEAGMRGFTLVGNDKNRTTYAYSAQKSIFGGTSTNLSGILPFAASGADIPLGEDNSTVYTIFNFLAAESESSDSEINGMYAAEFASKGGWVIGEAAEGLSELERYQHFPVGGKLTGGRLPKGLEFHPSVGEIVGTPEETGEFAFNIGSVKYRMVIDKAPLHYWAVNQSSYYGQIEFRGMNSPNFVFRYDTSDICSFERDRANASEEDGIKLDGNGAGLEALLADDRYDGELYRDRYVDNKPQFTAVDGTGSAVTNATPVGVYEIKDSVKPQSRNYTFIYSPERANGGLTILKRPIRVEYMNGTEQDKTVVTHIYNDDVGVVGNLQAWQGSDLTAEQKFTFTAGIARGTGAGNEEGYYNRLPLTSYDDRYVNGAILPGDSIEIVYTARYERNEKDKAQFPDSELFAIDGQMEYRDVRVEDIRLAGGVNSGNYILVGDTPVDPVREGMVVGEVELRRILSLRISQPPPLEYTYGDSYTRANELRYYILKDGDAKEGEYTYSDNSTGALGISVYWATKEEYQAYLAGNAEYEYGKDSLPLRQNQSFTTDYNDRYLCMACNSIDGNKKPTVIRQYEYEIRDENDKVVETRPLHLTVKPKDLVLTATAGSRYYGEENYNLAFTYDPRQLAAQDQRQGLTGAGAELKEILADQEMHAYKEPTLKAVRRQAGEELTTSTPELTPQSSYTGGDDSVIIYGAKSRNYRFLYHFTGENKPREDFGASVYRVEKRPIVVEYIKKTEPLVNIYADTHRIYTEGMTLKLEDVEVALPEHTETSSRYYYNGRQTAETPAIGFAPGSAAIFGTDKISFTYTATVIPTDGPDYRKYIDFSRGYFNMDEGVTDGYKDYPVQVSRLGLGKTPIKNDAGAVIGYVEDNYILVYRTSSLAVNQTPTQIKTVDGFVPEGAESQHYHAAVVRQDGESQPTEGKGRVYLRPIDKISIVSPGRLNYTYGSTYNPSQGEQGDLNGIGMRIHIEYEKDRIIDGHSVNNYEGNPTIGEVDFRMAGIQDNKVVTSFDSRSLKIYYVKEGQTKETAIENGQELDLRSKLYVNEHTGAGLVVSGKRGDQKIEVVSEIGTNSMGSRWTLQITPKTLRLKPLNQYRVYGENNPDFDFTFLTNELASWDREALGVADGQRISGSQLEELSGLMHYGYVEPIYTTTAVANSDVKNGGKEGYPITKLRDGSLDNYAFDYAQQGTLYIYPRPVRIAGITQEQPIYTIFSDVPGRLYYTNLVLDPANRDPKMREQFTLALPENGTYTYGSGANLITLPVTGDAFCSGDAMTLRVQVVYPTDLNLQGGTQEDIPVTVQNVSIVPGTRAASNYVLIMNGNDVAFVDNNNGAKGRVELRNIATISVLHAPKMTYTYGDILDLSALEIAINYEGDGQRERVPYVDAAYFEQFGLHVYYYDYPTVQERLDQWELITEENGYRPAVTGDHLTIAYTHDSQYKLPRDRFAANGKYLIVTAQIPGKDPSEPLIIPLAGAEDTQDPSRQIPVPIRVNPKAITYTLTAEDKIYDGTTQAAGSITFTNIFHQDGIVDNKNQNGITDVVYPVTEAAYEEYWNNFRSWQGLLDDFGGYIDENGYTFSTGRYEPNDPEKPTENADLAWTEGYTWGTGLSFAYGDPNVAYADGMGFTSNPAAKTVTVSGLRLAGPDAANYTLVGRPAGETVSVTTDTAIGLDGGLPDAVIHKANRAALPEDLLPQVEIDPHTNVVRLIYDQNVANIPGEKGAEEQEHQDELHFEYALQQIETEKVPAAADSPGEETEGGTSQTTVVTGVSQWAGPDGEKTWEDGRFFGGEVRRPPEITNEDPEAGPYVPKEEDLPEHDSSAEDTTIKGQVYQWKDEDPGFALDPSAYPGGTPESEPWTDYELYKTARKALERDAFYIPVVRAAETHNYNASLPLSSVEGYTYDKIYAILKAQEALALASTVEDYEAARAALDSALEAAWGSLQGAVGLAQTDAQAEVDALMAADDKDGNEQEERYARSAAAAVKTYRQVIETVSLKELQGADAQNDAEPYQVPTLEAVWFTDVETLPSKEVLDEVLWNKDPVRYRTYAWDKGFTAELTFDEEEEPINLAGGAFDVTVTDHREDSGEGTESTITVNLDGIATLYVDTTFPSNNQGIDPERIVLRPGSIMAVVGDSPVELGVTLYPTWARAHAILWTSSDPSVAAVNNRGRVIFLSAGTAVITAVVPSRHPGGAPLCSASVTVTVVEDWKEEYPASIFDFGHIDAFWDPGEDGDMLFLPENPLTRGEVAMLLAQFYVENPDWNKTGPESFPDVTGEEDYAEAVQLLGRMGIFQGYPEGNFGGERYISRAEFVTLLVRMSGIEVVDTTGQEHAFRDTGELDTWAYSEIDALSRQPGILLGVGEGYFAPDRAITRSEVAAILTRMLRFPWVQNGELVIPTDVGEDHWARENILQAVNGSQILEESLLTEE